MTDTFDALDGYLATPDAARNLFDRDFSAATSGEYIMDRLIDTALSRLIRMLDIPVDTHVESASR